MGTSVPPPGHVPPPGQVPASDPVAQPLGAPRPSRARRPRPQLLAAAVAIAVVAGLAFLLFGSGGSRLGSPIAQAATLSSSTPGYRMHMAVRVTSSALSSPVTATGSGVVDLRDQASSMSLTMNLGDEPQVVQALGGGTLRMDMVTDGSAIYVKLPAALTASLPTSGKQWIEVDLSKLSSVPGLSVAGGKSDRLRPQADPAVASVSVRQRRR